MEHELLYKEAVVLTLVAIFSFTFYTRIDKPSLYIGFILLSAVFYFITVAEEKKTEEGKKLHEYFEFTSSYFVLSGFFFIVSYAVLKYLGQVFLIVLLAIAVVLFSVGFMRLLFSRFEQ